MTIYVVHKGDEVVAVGEAEEVMERMGWKRGTLDYMATPCAKARDLKKMTVVDKVEVEG